MFAIQKQSVEKELTYLGFEMFNDDFILALAKNFFMYKFEFILPSYNNEYTFVCSNKKTHFCNILLCLDKNKIKDNIKIGGSHSFNCPGFKEFWLVKKNKNKFEMWVERLLFNKDTRFETAKFLFFHSKLLNDVKIVIKTDNNNNNNNATPKHDPRGKKQPKPNFAIKKVQKREYKTMKENNISSNIGNIKIYNQRIGGEEYRYHQYRTIKDKNGDFVQYRCSKRNKTNCKRSFWLRKSDYLTSFIDAPHNCFQ